MQTENPILIIVITTIIGVFALSRPTAVSEPSGVTESLPAKPDKRASDASDFSLISRVIGEPVFLLGFTLGIALAVFCNLVPWYNSHNTPQADGIITIGFPLIFQSSGGVIYATSFSFFSLCLDAIFAFALATLGGYAALGYRSVYSSPPIKNRR
jgi:hypothetical protein